MIWRTTTLDPDPANVLAFNNTAVAGRDAGGRLHVVWYRDLDLYHWREPGHLRTLPAGGARQMAKATIALDPHGLVVHFAWYQERSEIWYDRLNLATGATAPIRVAAKVTDLHSLALAGAWSLERQEGVGLVAWTRDQDEVYAWSSLSAKTSTLDTTAGAKPDVSLATDGAQVAAVWDAEASAGGKELRYSLLGNPVGPWSVSVATVPNLPSGASDPSCLFVPGPALVVPFTDGGKIYAQRLDVKGGGWSAMNGGASLGDGAFPRAALTIPGGLLVSWENAAGPVGMASFAHGAATATPVTMPSTGYWVSPSVSAAGGAVDLVALYRADRGPTGQVIWLSA